MTNRSLSLRIARLQNDFVRETNDMHIFIKQALPLLEEAKEKYGASRHKKDRRYFVPTIGRIKFARRTDNELKRIYDRFITRSLYETFLVMGVSQFETFLADVLREIFFEYPRKLGLSSPGIPPCRQVALDVLLDATDLDEAVDGAIEKQLASVFFARPREYLAYVEAVVGADFLDDELDKYVELKATRDLIVHGSGEINALYLTKAGRKARGDLGDEVVVDGRYFGNVLATMKRLTGVVKRDAEKAFPRMKKPS